MGGTSYSSVNRSARAETKNYATASIHTVFTQQSKGEVHKDMDPNGVTLREARDSAVHPVTVPVIIGLDVTGSMGHIPHNLIKEGLPKLVQGIIDNGVPSPAIMFMALGDHECDRHPLQISQFESGDAELDLWLTRSYLEGGGGGNGGESYSLAHFFAANYCKTDHFEKRGKKGILITIGDEPNLEDYPSNAFREIMGNGDISSTTSSELISAASKEWHVYHILPNKYLRQGAESQWKEALGDRCVQETEDRPIAAIISEIVVKHAKEDIISFEKADKIEPEETDTKEDSKPNIL